MATHKAQKPTKANSQRRPDASWPQFNAEAPPKDWEFQHNHAQRLTIFERAWGYTAVDRPSNRPVPRQASCHFYNSELTATGTSIYFY